VKSLVQAREESLTVSIFLVFLFSLLMAVAAYVRIPLFFTPVPLTMQTFVLYLSLAVLGRRAGLVQLMYAAFGACGLAVFTNGGSGLSYLLGPTGGYILGFLAASLIVSLIMPEKKTFLKSFAVFSVAAVIIYSLGMGWLMISQGLSFSAVLAAGLFPFLAGEFIKITAASFLSARV